MKRTINFTLSLLASAALLYFIIRFIGNIDLSLASSYLAFEIFLTVSAIYLLLKVINTIRYYVVFQTKHFFKTFLILLFSNFMLSVLPFRVGELSYLFLFKKHLKLNFLDGSTRLLSIRILDYLCIILFFLLSFPFIDVQQLQKIPTQSLILAISTFLGAAIIITSIIAFILYKHLRDKLSHLVIALQKSIHIIKKDFFLVLISSVFYWFLRFYIGIYLFRSVGITIDFFSLLFLSTLMMIISIIPLHTWAGFGVFEAGWVSLFVVFGLSKTGLLEKVLAVHTTGLLYVSIYGTIAYIILRILTRNRSDHTYSKEIPSK